MFIKIKPQVKLIVVFSNGNIFYTFKHVEEHTIKLTKAKKKKIIKKK